MTPPAQICEEDVFGEAVGFFKMLVDRDVWRHIRRGAGPARPPAAEMAMSARPMSTFDGAASGPTLVLVRHGESEGNRANAFTGRRDVELTERGVAEAKAVGAALVRDGFRFAHTFSSALILISDVAKELNITTRSVQATFEKYRATSPLAYLNAVRLGRARRRLQTIGGDETISGIALDVGFSHFGRFSQRYKRRYDESPSRTVADVREAISVAG